MIKCLAWGLAGMSLTQPPFPVTERDTEAERGAGTGSGPHRTLLAEAVRVPASVSKSALAPSLLHVSPHYSCKDFSFGSKPNEWDYRVQIFWGSVFFWLTFVTGCYVECPWADQALGPKAVQRWVREHGTGGRPTWVCQPGHLGLGPGPNCFSRLTSWFLISTLSLVAPSSWDSCNV